jgi:hypothetical protein
VPSRLRKIILAATIMVATAGVCHAADKLKTFYSGSSMASDSSARTITLQFAKDGTGTYEDNSGKGDIKKTMHWFRDGKTVTVELEPEQGQTTGKMLVFELKHKYLVPTDAFNAQIGALGFPALHPFGPGDVGTSSGLSTCVTGAPPPCAMRENWSSRAK